MFCVSLITASIFNDNLYVYEAMRMIQCKSVLYYELY